MIGLILIAMAMVSEPCQGDEMQMVRTLLAGALAGAIIMPALAA